MCVHMHETVWRVYERGQHAGTDSLLPTGLTGQTQALRLSDKHFAL